MHESPKNISLVATSYHGHLKMYNLYNIYTVLNFSRWNEDISFELVG